MINKNQCRYVFYTIFLKSNLHKISLDELFALFTFSYLNIPSFHLAFTEVQYTIFLNSDFTLDFPIFFEYSL